MTEALIEMEPEFPDRVTEIKWLETQVERLDQRIKLDSEARDEYRWREARLIVAELEAGKSQRALAAEIGKGQTHVSLMARVHRDYHGNRPEGQSFDSLYQAAKAPAKPKIEVHDDGDKSGRTETAYGTLARRESELEQAQRTRTPRADLEPWVVAKRQEEDTAEALERYRVQSAQAERLKTETDEGKQRALLSGMIEGWVLAETKHKELIADVCLALFQREDWIEETHITDLKELLDRLEETKYVVTTAINKLEGIKNHG